jgi:hypothetical protein
VRVGKVARGQAPPFGFGSARSRAARRRPSASAISPAGSGGPRNVSTNSAGAISAQSRNRANSSSVSIDGSGRKPKRTSADGAFT